MLIRPSSDIHLEFGDFTVPPLDGDSETILVLAGDIGLVHKANLTERLLPFLSRCNAQFKKVIYVVGNHEHYGGSFRKTHTVLREALTNANLNNVVLLEKETYVIDDIAFIGATLWTDCDRQSPYAPYLFQGMSDSRVIRTGPNETLPYERKFTAQDTWIDHALAATYIRNAVNEQRQAGFKPVVVVHHGVTGKSIHPKYRGPGNDLNMFFASEMTDWWIQCNPALIIHGHTHECLDYYVDDTKETCSTRVVCNPRGYANIELNDFNPLLTIDTDTL